MAKNDEKRPELPIGYCYPDVEEAARLHDELQRELPPGHLLYGVPVEVFAARETTDDVLFRHLKTLQHFTVVHLTWIGRTEID